MHGQTIHHQMQRFLAATHQVLEQINEQITSQFAFVRGKPECAFGIDRRSGADALPLLRPRCLTAFCRRLVMDT